MATGSDGAVWFNQFFSGLVRHDPDNGRSDLVYPGNSALNGRTVVSLVAHPDGTLLIMHDLNDAGLVDVLSDPAHWRNSSNWSALRADRRAWATV